MPSPITPKALQPGATIALLSPSARLNHALPTTLSRAVSRLTHLGYKVVTPYSAPDNDDKAGDQGIQASIRARLSELRSALTDPSISAIICTLGGDSLNELLPALAADERLHAAIRADPKIVVGYSDITCLHWALYALTGLRTFYGPTAMAELGEPSSPSSSVAETDPVVFCLEYLFRAIADPTNPLGPIPRSTAYAPKHPSFFFFPSEAQAQAPSLLPSPPWTWLRPGKARGRLFGGCLPVMARMQRFAPPSSWRGRIVFVETAMGQDVTAPTPLGEVRAGFADLIVQGVFDGAAGLVVGRAYGYDSEEQRARFAGVIRELLCEGAVAEQAGGDFPILLNVDFGHTTPMVTLPMDTMAVLDSERDEFAVVEPGVV